jgi:hypothetical protein
VWELAVVALASTGCSFFMNTAPSAPSERTPEAAHACTNDALVPILDTVSAGVGAANIAVSAGAYDQVEYGSIKMDKKVGLALGVTQLVLAGAAATYGYVQLARCNALRREVGLEPPVAQAPPKGNATTYGVASVQEPEQPAVAVPPDSEHHELPEWSALRRVPLTATEAGHPAPSRFSGSTR